MTRWVVARSRSAPNPWRRGAGLLYAQVVRPSLPEWVTRLRPNHRRKEFKAFSCIAPAFDAAVPKIDSGLDWRRTRGVHAVQAQRLTMGHLQARMEVWATQGAQDGIEYRYPLLDRRLVEFCLGVPEELFSSESYSRALFRNAVRGLLPDKLRLATVKLERLRVDRYIDLQWAASAQLLTTLIAASHQSHQSNPARYLDMACVHRYAQTDALPAAHEIGAAIGRERQVQVWIMMRGNSQRRLAPAC